MVVLQTLFDESFGLLIKYLLQRCWFRALRDLAVDLRSIQTFRVRIL